MYRLRDLNSKTDEYRLHALPTKAMDIGDNGGDIGFQDDGEVKRQRPLPDDLPKSLDDRKNVSTHYTAETEMYDAWQGKMNIIPQGGRQLILGRPISILDKSGACEAPAIQQSFSG